MFPRILLLGANGFIGRSVYREFADAGEPGELIVHARPRPQPTWLPRHADWYPLDLERADLAAFGHMIDTVQPDAIVNCAGRTSGSASAHHSANVDTVTKMIATLAGRPNIHFVQIGSAAEYGSQREGVPVAETALAAPKSVYGLSKYEATRRLMDSVAAGRINVTILRVFNPLGRYSPAATLAGSAALQIRDALRDRRADVHLGNLDSWRDYVDTRDVARAALVAARERRHGGAVFNVGRGEAVHSRDLIRTLAGLAGFDGSIVESDARSERSHVVRWQCADITAIREQLGWSPWYTAEESLRELWDETNRRTPAVCS